MKGTAAFLDPIYVQDGVATVLMDGFALGVTILVALTGQPAPGLKQRCRHMLKWPAQPHRWQPTGVPDAKGGAWGEGVATCLAEIVAGLNEHWAEDRMPLADVLERLEALATAAGVDAAESSEMAAEAEDENGEEEERVCIICCSAPREVRFACGHATCCEVCLPAVVTQHRKCPTCLEPFGAQPVIERGPHLGIAPTFELPAARSPGRS